MEKYDYNKKATTAERLRLLRKEKGLSTKKLEEKLRDIYKIDISESSLKNYEIQNPESDRFTKGFGLRIEYLYALADFYDVSIDYLSGRTDTKTPNLDIKGACKVTGLSEQAISAIQNIDTATDSYYYDTLGFKPPLLKILNYLCEIGFTSELTKALGRCLYEILIRKNYFDNCHSTEQEQSVLLPSLGYLSKEIEDEIKAVIKPLILEFQNDYMSGGNTQ